MTKLLAISFLITVLVALGGYLFNCYMAGRWLTWKEWGEFNGD